MAALRGSSANWPRSLTRRAVGRTPTGMADRAYRFDFGVHFASLVDACEGEFQFRGGTAAADVRQWQLPFHQRLLEILGIGNIEDDLAGFVPRARRFATVDMGSYTRESWRILTEPTVPLPFYLLRPKRAAANPPLVLTPHGHHHPHLYAGLANNPEEEAHLRDGERDVAVQAVEQGYLVIAPTTRAFGDTRAAADQEKQAVSSCRLQLMHDLLLGRTPIGDRVWDMSRLIDWALAYQEVDRKRIAITGNSGGGTVSLFAAACDSRITVAVPGCYFSTFAGSIGSIIHCDCNYVPGILRLGEMPDVAGLIAPRHFLAVAGRDDPIFPIAHTEAAFAQLAAIYRAAGVPDRCELYVGNGGHRYYKERVWPFIAEAFANPPD